MRFQNQLLYLFAWPLIRFLCTLVILISLFISPPVTYRSPLTKPNNSSHLRYFNHLHLMLSCSATSSRENYGQWSGPKVNERMVKFFQAWEAGLNIEHRRKDLTYEERFKSWNFFYVLPYARVEKNKIGHGVQDK